MTNRLMISVAAIALMAGTGLANAQGSGMSREAPSAAPAQQSAPSSDRGTSAGQMSRDAAQPEMKSTQSEEKSPAGHKSQRADEGRQGSKNKTLSSENADKSNTGKTTGENVKNENREQSNDLRNAQRSDEKRTDEKMSNEFESKTGRHSQTVGQAGAGAKLSSEQRTKITTVIKEQHIAPVSHVNFSISVGTRVPRDVSFHPLPAEVVSIYPEWRGYEFILVGDQLVVIDPRSLEIVAVLDA